MNTTHISRLTFKLSCLNFLDYFNYGQPTCLGPATESEHCRICNMQSVPSGHGETRMNFRQWLQQGQDFSAVKFSAAQPLLLSHSCRGGPASRQIMEILIFFFFPLQTRGKKIQEVVHAMCPLFLASLFGGRSRKAQTPGRVCKNLNLSNSWK